MKPDKNYFYPDFTYLTQQKLQELARLMKLGQNVTCLWLPGVGRSAAITVLAEDALLRKSLGIENYLLLNLDLSLNDYFFMRQLEERLECVGGSVMQALAELASKTEKTFFVLDNQSQQSNDRTRFIDMLLQEHKGKLHTISHTIEHQPLLDGSLDSLSLQNFLYMGYFNDAQAAEWLEINQLKHSQKLSSTQIQEIISYSGGVPMLMRTFLRGLEQGLKIEAIKSSQELQSLQKNLVARLHDYWPHLKSIYHQRDEQVPVAMKQLLVSLGLCQKIESRLALRGKWLVTALTPNSHTTLLLDREAGTLLLEEFDILSLLSPKQKQLVLEVAAGSLQGSYTSRERLAELIWGGGFSYSEWSLDQQISRLRKSLLAAGVDDLVVSRRGKGYEIDSKRFTIKQVN